MPFLDPEELKPKLREVFETVVIPQIKKAKMKQTAVEWLVEQLTMVYPKIEEMKLLTDKAKAMEKEQIIEANENQCIDEDGDFMTGEQYYNETFKST